MQISHSCLIKVENFDVTTYMISFCISVWSHMYIQNYRLTYTEHEIRTENSVLDWYRIGANISIFVHMHIGISL